MNFPDSNQSRNWGQSKTVKYSISWWHVKSLHIDTKLLEDPSCANHRTDKRWQPSSRLAGSRICQRMNPRNQAKWRWWGRALRHFNPSLSCESPKAELLVQKKYKVPGGVYNNKRWGYVDRTENAASKVEPRKERNRNRPSLSPYISVC